MSKTKLLLDVVDDISSLAANLKTVAEDICSLADSIKTVAEAMMQNEPRAVATAPRTEAAPAISEKATSAPKEAKPLTIEQVRAVLLVKKEEKGAEVVQNLLRKYGSPYLTKIDPRHYAALLADAEVL